MTGPDGRSTDASHEHEEYHLVRQAPERTCVGCRRTRTKAELRRIARTPDGVAYDPDQRLDGRGAYVCPDPRCIAAARRRGGHTLRRALRGGRPDEVQSALDAVRATIDDTGPADVHEHHEEHNA